jgi:hypothetical protein
MAYNVETNEIVSAMTHLLKHFAVLFSISNRNLSSIVLPRIYEPPIVYALFTGSISAIAYYTHLAISLKSCFY